jgi:PAS domain S-box-containing protein
MDAPNLDAANRCTRDIIALTTLASVWLGAKPLRIAESLLAALDTTLDPRLAYIYLPAEGDQASITLATIDRNAAKPQLIAELGSQILAWSVQHDPDEILILSVAGVTAPVRVCVYPLGFNAESGILAAGFTDSDAPTRIQRTLLNVAANQALVACKNTALRQQAEDSRLEAEALNKVVRILAAELDLQAVLQKATDAAQELTGAQSSAFFYRITHPQDETALSYTVSGAPRDVFEKFAHLRSAEFFDPAFAGAGPFRIADVLADPSIARISPHHLMAGGLLPVRSYLAVPVLSRTGELLGGLFLGHPQPGIFTNRAERLAVGLAAQAAIAIDNASLYSQAQKEIADRKRVEKTLRETQARLDATLTAAEIATWTWDIQKNRMVADKNSAQLFSLTPEEARGERIETYIKAIHPEDRPGVEKSVARALEKGTYEMEYRILQSDGSSRWVVARGKVEYDEAGRPAQFPGVIIDITERRKAEEKLRQSEERFRFMAESMPLKIFTVLCYGGADYFNRQWVEFTGLPLEQLQNWSWSQFVHADDLAENILRWKHSIQTGDSFQIEHRFRRKDGVYRWHLTRAQAMCDADGKVLMWIGASTDIDDQKQWSENLEHAVQERTVCLKETIGELEGFSYSISHDLRAPLRSMKTFAEILAEECGEEIGPEARDYIRRIITSANRMDRLIQDVLNYSRIANSELRLETINLRELLDGIVESYPNLRPSRVQITIKEPIPLVRANQAAVTQCLANLLGNAVKFVTEGVYPQVHIWAEQHPDCVKVFIKDNGIGIPPDARERIFGIFQRLNPKYEGTGIGLAIVKKAAERMGGRVGFESQPGTGTTFCLELQAIGSSDPTKGNAIGITEAQKSRSA